MSNYSKKKTHPWVGGRVFLPAGFYAKKTLFSFTEEITVAFWLRRSQLPEGPVFYAKKTALLIDEITDTFCPP